MAKDYGTIKIDQSEFERHNTRRREMGLTWMEYIDGEAPKGITIEDVREAAREGAMEAIEQFSTHG